MSYKIGVIGDKESILPFKLFGFTVRYGNDVATTTSAFDEMIEAKYSVIYITEDCAQQIMEKIEKFNDQLSPAIVLIPTYEGSKGIGRQAIQKNMEKAVGQNIL
ncbi:V-type ATP synthase subunit F [Enterococcus olivae]